MNIPASRHFVFVAFVLGAVLVAPTQIYAQMCLDPGAGADSMQGNSGSDNGDSSNNGGNDTFNTVDTQQQVGILNSGGSVDAGLMLGGPGDGGDVSGGSAAPAPDPINVTINASTTVYAESPTSVSSTASTASTPISLHTIEYINCDGSDGGIWQQQYNAAGSGISDQCSTGVTFPSPGTYFVRSGASTDGGNTWTYSDQLTVYVNDCRTHPTVYIQAKPKPGMEKWFTESNEVSKQFKVKYTNPYP